MVDTNLTDIEVVEPWETFLEPLGYEFSDDVAIGYIDLMLKSDIDKALYRFGTYEEITQSTYQASLEKVSHKKIAFVMKKALSEAGMSEEESQVVRQTIFGMKQTSEQGVMYVTPLSVGQASNVSIAEISTEQSIPYVFVSAKQPSGSKR